MIVDVAKRFIFVHIPRTAGVSISMSLKPYLSQSVIFDTWTGRHRTAAEIKRMVGPVWDSCFRFAVWRPVVEIKASFHRLVQQGWTMRDHIRDPEWYKFVERNHDLSADELFAAIGWPDDDLSWKQLWLTEDGNDLGVVLFEFSRIREQWPEICCECRVPANAPLLHLNHARPIE